MMLFDPKGVLSIKAGNVTGILQIKKKKYSLACAWVRTHNFSCHNSVAWHTQLECIIIYKRQKTELSITGVIKSSVFALFRAPSFWVQSCVSQVLAWRNCFLERNTLVSLLCTQHLQLVMEEFPRSCKKTKILRHLRSQSLTLATVKDWWPQHLRLV